MSTIKIRLKRQDRATLVRLLITHPMETGRKLDQSTGIPIPAHFIQEVKIEHNAKLIANWHLSTAVSRDPYLAIRIKDGHAGDAIKVSWVDNLGQSDSAQTVIE